MTKTRRSRPRRNRCSRSFPIPRVWWSTTAAMSRRPRWWFRAWAGSSISYWVRSSASDVSLADASMQLIPERKPDQRDEQRDVDDDSDSLKYPTPEQGESAVTREGKETPHEQGRIASTAYDRDGGAQANGGPNEKPRNDGSRFRRPERDQAEQGH